MAAAMRWPGSYRRLDRRAHSRAGGKTVRTVKGLKLLQRKSPQPLILF
jgi:hypothetical protein